MTKILFLDVDGVLNYSKMNREGQRWPFVLSTQAIDLLDWVVNSTGCKIVMSSTWRLHGDAMDYLKKKYPRLRELLHDNWRTPYGVEDEIRLSDIKNGLRHVRGFEINKWLSDHPDVTAYAIVDDDGDMLPDQKANFVQTSWETGMLDHHADELAAILNRSGLVDGR